MLQMHLLAGNNMAKKKTCNLLFSFYLFLVQTRLMQIFFEKTDEGNYQKKINYIVINHQSNGQDILDNLCMIC